MELKIKTENIEKKALLYLNKWYRMLLSKNTQGAYTWCGSFIAYCKRLLKDKSDRFSEATKKNALVFAILFRGLQDFTKIAEMVELEEWGNDNSLLERVWDYWCDCKERLDYFLSYGYSSGITKWVLEELNKIEQFYSDKWGTALYFSPEIFIDGKVCNICGKDFRTCNHKNGQIYNGVMCVSPPQKISNARNVTIVSNPSDRRCRLWPWKYDEKTDTLNDVCIITSFRLDDFMEEKN